MKAFIMRMKKLIMITMAFVLLIPFLGGTVYASAGTISLSDPTAKVGEDVSVTIKVTATGSETIQSVKMSLSYDASALEFKGDSQATGENGSIQLSGESDSSIKTYTLNFKSLKNSTSNIKVTDYEILDSNTNVMEMSKIGTATVTITGDNQAVDASLEAGAQETQMQETIAQAGTNQAVESKIVTPPKKDVEVKIAGTPFYVCKIPQNLIPEGFDYIGYEYQGAAVDALKKDNFILFYLNQIGEEPFVFYVYDPNTEAFSFYAPVNSSLKYTVVSLEEDVVLPEGYTETQVSVGGVAVTAWQSELNSEYYLLYLMNSEGTKGLYLYDVVEKTVQRYYESETDNTVVGTDSFETKYNELNANYNKDIQSRMQVIYIFLVIMVILVFVIINLIFRLLDKKHATVDDEEEEDEEELELHFEDLETQEKTVVKKGFFHKKRKAYEEDLDDYDEYEDDYEEDYQEESKEYEEELDKKTKKAAKLEKKEKAKLEKTKKSKRKSDSDSDESFENSEDDFDDSDDFELQIFDLDDK